MHPGPADGVFAVRWGAETWAGDPGTGVLGRGVPELGEPTLPAQAGLAVGDLGAMALAVGFLLVLGLTVVVLWHSDLTDGLSSTGTEAGRPSTESTSEPATPDSPSVESSAEATADSTVEDVEGGQRAVETEKTDTEEIVEILEANEGRMRQAAIVEDTDWSKSKVSMVLSEMEEDGDISKLRVGRENIVSLRGNEPEAAGSPFEEE